MKNKTLAIFGIGTYILSVIASASDFEGNPVAPVALIVISGIANIVFIIMATVRLWKVAKIVSVILPFSAITLFALTIIQEISLPKGNSIILLSNAVNVVNFGAFVWAIFKLFTTPNQRDMNEKFKDLGLTPEEGSLILEDLQQGKQEEALQRIATAQERQRTIFKEATGIDARDITPEIGREISWADIVYHVFRVLEFDRAGTTIEQNDQVKALTPFNPYGYLLVESPILTQRARLPIIHRVDFLLAASVFEEPKLAVFFTAYELLVTYAPKQLLPKGLSGSFLHVLHYVIVPRGTLDSYYSMNNDVHMAKPDPKKLFGPFVYFVYEDQIKVQVNPKPNL